MKICCIADLHGKLDFKVPEADLLLVAGDLCPAYHEPWLCVDLQSDWLNIEFRYWLSFQPVKECVSIFGNHDWIGEFSPYRIPKMNANFHYLQDSSIEIMGLKIYGSPWQLEFNNWAFNKTESQLISYWENIPEDIDILLVHSPPYKIMDKVDHGNFVKHIGSKSLKKRIKEIRPKIAVFGHNHNGYGIVEEDGIKFVNASLLNEKYEMVNEPVILEI